MIMLIDGRQERGNAGLNINSFVLVMDMSLCIPCCSAWALVNYGLIGRITKCLLGLRYSQYSVECNITYSYVCAVHWSFVRYVVIRKWRIWLKCWPARLESWLMNMQNTFYVQSTCMLFLLQLQYSMYVCIWPLSRCWHTSISNSYVPHRSNSKTINLGKCHFRTKIGRSLVEWPAFSALWAASHANDSICHGKLQIFLAHIKA